MLAYTTCPALASDRAQAHRNRGSPLTTITFFIVILFEVMVFFRKDAAEGPDFRSFRHSREALGR